MTLKAYILHQLREIKREVLVAVEDLSEEDMRSHEPCGHWPIAWILQHFCLNVDRFLYFSREGSLFLEHDERMLTRPRVDPQPGEPYPPLSDLTSKWSTVIDAAIGLIELDGDDDLQTTPPHGKEPVVESCLRVINHTNAHLRAIWCILGERRVDAKFPDQQTWLP